MRTTTSSSTILVAALMSSGLASAQIVEGQFYNPSNVGSPTGYTEGHELFRTIGCPGRELLGTPCPVLDSDGDGVPDYKDKCPGTPLGTKVDADGCPLPEVAKPAPEPMPAPVVAPAPMKVLAGANFDFDKADIRPEDFAALDKNVATLKEWGDVKVEIGGHTDSVGTESYNNALSLRRAESIRNYLVDKGIAADRLTVRGYGESQPVADNATEEGRLANRRVELVKQQ